MRSAPALLLIALAVVSISGCAVDASGPPPGDERYDLEIVGHGFDAYEGRQVHVAIAGATPGIAADWLVEYGAFRMRFADAIDRDRLGCRDQPRFTLLPARLAQCTSDLIEDEGESIPDCIGFHMHFRVNECPRFLRIAYCTGTSGDAATGETPT